MNLKITHQYDDIIGLEHHQSKRHPPMSLYARSAQFAPFAALTGYEDAVKETARETNERVELEEDWIAILDMKLQLLQENIGKKEEVTMTYFVPDARKDGGSYLTIVGVVKKIDRLEGKIILADKREIPIAEILAISSKNEYNTMVRRE